MFSPFGSTEPSAEECGPSTSQLGYPRPEAPHSQPSAAAAAAPTRSLKDKKLEMEMDVLKQQKIVLHLQEEYCDRPISNLPFIGKIIEKVVFNQLNNYLNSNGFLDNFQSGFRVHHSTETALIKIINDIRFNSDSGKISVLVLLDLSAAFDTVDHNILLERLENWVGAFWDGTQMVQVILRRERLLCEYRRA